MDKPEPLPLIKPEEVAKHCAADDCWVIVDNNVCDVTTYMKKHPGGDQILLSYAGQDATAHFVKAAHSVFAIKMMKKYAVGILDTSSAPSLLSPMYALSHTKANARAVPRKGKYPKRPKRPMAPARVLATVEVNVPEQNSSETMYE